MGSIIAQLLYPFSDSAPTNGYDPGSGLGYTLWEVGDEASFTLRIPDDYVEGGSFQLIIEESTDSSEAHHRWTGGSILLKAGEDSTSVIGSSESFDEEFVSAAPSNQLTQRQIAISSDTSSGYIDTAQIKPGDLLFVSLKRDSASTGEDPNGIKVFNLTVTFHSAISSESSNCSGRVGTIIDTVRDLFNESTGGFLSDQFILRSINRCLEEIATENYWRRESWIPCQAGENVVDLVGLIPDFQDIHQVRFSGAGSNMRSLGGYQEYQALRSSSDSSGIPESYIVQNNGLYVWPSPNITVDSGFAVYHSYLPSQVTCSSENPNPPIPKGHDLLIVYFVLKQAFLRDRHAPGADTKFMEYSQLYEHEKAKLLGAGDPPSMYVRSYR